MRLIFFSLGGERSIESAGSNYDWWGRGMYYPMVFWDETQQFFPVSSTRNPGSEFDGSIYYWWRNGIFHSSSSRGSGLETADRHRSVWGADYLFNILCRGFHPAAGRKLHVGFHLRTGARDGIAADDRGGFLSDNVSYMILWYQAESGT